MEFRTVVRNHLSIKADNKQIDDFFNHMDADGEESHRQSLPYLLLTYSLLTPYLLLTYSSLTPHLLLTTYLLLTYLRRRLP